MTTQCLLTILFLLTGPATRAESPLTGPDETATQITAAIQAGNAADLAKKFNPMVDLTLPGYDDTYSRVQAGQILKDFFSQYPVKSFTLTKSGSSPDGSRYHIGTLEAGKKTFRVYFLLKSSGGTDQIHQFQIQDN